MYVEAHHRVEPGGRRLANTAVYFLTVVYFLAGASADYIGAADRS